MVCCVVFCVVCDVVGGGCVIGVDVGCGWWWCCVYFVECVVFVV